MTKGMTRKALALLMALMLTLTVAVIPAYACDDSWRGNACAVSTRDYSKEKVELIVAAANAEIAWQVKMVKRIANERNVEWLLIGLVASTNRIAERAINQCARYGAEVVCEYEEVEILGRVVLIDPLRVISFRR